jgi:exopolysaccharide biosynthesis polyprenyl glycosylphosphotransferase
VTHLAGTAPQEDPTAATASLAVAAPKAEKRQSALVRIGESAPERSTSRDTVFKSLLVVADLCAAVSGLALTSLATGQRLDVPSIATLPLIIVILKIGGRYDRDEVVMRKSTLDEAPALMALAAAYALVWSLVTITLNIHSSRGAVLVLWAGTASCLILLRASARAAGQNWAPVERALILGNGSSEMSLARRLAADSAARLEIVGFLPFDDQGSAEDEDESGTGPASLAIEDLRAAVESLDVHRVIVIPTSTDPASILESVTAANVVGVRVSIVPSILEVVGSAVEFDEVGGVTLLGVRRPGLSRSSALVKRAMDIVGSAFGLIVLAPFGALVAIAIKLDTPGPVFFRQPRIGRNGRTFQMIKFRSMVLSAEQQRQELEALNESHGIFKMTRDPRVTRVGRLLRQSSLDELPQLINVLRGEMSLVGPRPLIPEEDKRVEGPHRNRLEFSPGMTGPWQVLGPERPPLSDMVKLDYLYGANWSLWSDLKYIVRTLIHVVARRGV